MPIRGTSGNDHYDFSDGPGSVEYYTAGGSDTVVGSRFADVFRIEMQIDEFPINILNGGAGDDTFYGGFSGRATFIGGTGADTFVGGAGQDIVSYERSVRAVTVDLLAGRGRGGEASGDVYRVGD